MRDSTQPRPAHRRVAAVIPAHNEADSLPATIRSLRQQTRPPDSILVVSDNSTDSTAGTARSCGAGLTQVEVIETVDNLHRKAGALNHGLRQLLPTLGRDDVVLVMDADSTLDPAWIDTAMDAMPRHGRVRAVSGMCRGEQRSGMLAVLQRMEYEQIAADRTRHSGRTRMLSGAASAFSAMALREVALHRGVLLPGQAHEVYNTHSLTEDHELTLAIRCLGGQITSPAGCRVITELAPSWRGLAAQRMRWDRGGLADLIRYGLTPVTRGQWGYQLERLAGMVAHLAVAALLIWIAVTPVTLALSWWALAGAVVGGIPAVIGVRRSGWRHIVLATLLLPQFCYYLFLELVAVRAYLHIITNRATQWAH